MQIELIKKDDKVVGWKLVADNEDDRLKMGSVRKYHQSCHAEVSRSGLEFVGYPLGKKTPIVYHSGMS